MTMIHPMDYDQMETPRPGWGLGVHCPLWSVGETEVPRAEIEPRSPEPFCPPQMGAGSHLEVMVRPSRALGHLRIFFFSLEKYSPPRISAKTPGTCGGPGASGPGVDPDVGRAQR